LKTKDKIIDYFNNLEEVKRIKELEPYIKNNKEINDKFIELKDIQKKMINAKEFNQINIYHELKKEYDKKKNELFDLPFVEEYLELVDIVNNMLNDLSNEINYLIDKEINK
jgi:cell fate (sporulation/competence/biofilm development) regulator YmcA (YheA/YmcA/DUF963 family)